MCTLATCVHAVSDLGARACAKNNDGQQLRSAPNHRAAAQLLIEQQGLVFLGWAFKHPPTACTLLAGLWF
jgi:hypothetical protein